MMNELHSQGKTVEAIADCLKRAPLDPHVVNAIKFAFDLGYGFYECYFYWFEFWLWILLGDSWVSGVIWGLSAMPTSSSLRPFSSTMGLLGASLRSIQILSLLMKMGGLGSCLTMILLPLLMVAVSVLQICARYTISLNLYWSYDSDYFVIQIFFSWANSCFSSNC